MLLDLTRQPGQLQQVAPLAQLAQLAASVSALVQLLFALQAHIKTKPDSLLAKRLLDCTPTQRVLLLVLLQLLESTLCPLVTTKPLSVSMVPSVHPPRLSAQLGLTALLRRQLPSIWLQAMFRMRLDFGSRKSANQAHSALMELALQLPQFRLDSTRMKLQLRMRPLLVLMVSTVLLGQLVQRWSHAQKMSGSRLGQLAQAQVLQPASAAHLLSAWLASTVSME